MKAPTKRQLIGVIRKKGIDAAQRLVDGYKASCDGLMKSAISSAAQQALTSASMPVASNNNHKKKAKKKAVRKPAMPISDKLKNRLLGLVSNEGSSNGEVTKKFNYPQKYTAVKKLLIREGKIETKQEKRHDDKREKEYLYRLQMAS